MKGSSLFADDRLANASARAGSIDMKNPTHFGHAGYFVAALLLTAFVSLFGRNGASTSTVAVPTKSAIDAYDTLEMDLKLPRQFYRVIVIRGHLWPVARYQWMRP